MTEHHQDVARFPEGGQPIVYIRVADPSELPPDVKAGGSPIYALHDAAGNRLALAADRNLAFALARKNDLTPMSVH